jgi:glycosyltransferase involved in cell wall biosynthesis
MSGDPIRVLELRSVRGTGGGPEKTILLGAQRADPRHVAVTVCYIRDARDPIFGVGVKANGLGIDYVEVVERTSFDPRVWPSLRDIVRERKIDLVHAHDYKTDVAALMLARAEHVVPLATAHGWTGQSRRERYLYYPLDKRVLRQFPLVIAVSSDIRSALVAAGVPAARTTVVLNGINPKAFRRDRSREVHARQALGLGPDEIVISAVGRLEPQKRFDLLIRACAALRANYPRLRLLIAGDGSLKSELRRLAAELIGDAGCLLGHYEDVGTLHHATDVFVQSSDYEGTPNAVLEAMALETPVVATAAGGTAEIMQDGVHGRIVPCGDVDALVSAIERTLCAEADTVARVARARAAVETTLSFDTRMTTVENIYRELMGRDSLINGAHRQCA